MRRGIGRRFWLSFLTMIALCGWSAVGNARELPPLLGSPGVIAPGRGTFAPVSRSGPDLPDEMPNYRRAPAARSLDDLPIPPIRRDDRNFDERKFNDDREPPARPRPRATRMGKVADAKVIPASALDDLPPPPIRTDADPYRSDFDFDSPDDYRSPYSKDSSGDRRKGSTATSGKFGDRFFDLFSADKAETRFFSDHGFDHFATPISNPFLFEDPRALTEIRPVFIYQQIPGSEKLFQGGNFFFLGGRASLALTERFSFTLNKFGSISSNPGGESLLDSKFSFAEVWLGPKYTFYRDLPGKTAMAGGIIFQIPTGSSETFQDTGNLSIVPYYSIARTLAPFRIGDLNAIATTGYAFSTDDIRSEYFYLSGHLDLDLFNRQRYYPILEFNYFQYTRNGSNINSGSEGLDLINFGAQAKGSGTVTGAIGGRFKITEAAQIGATFELPLIGQKDVFDYRFTVDLILRY